MKDRSVDYNSIAGQYDCRYEVGDYSEIERQLLEFVTGARSGNILEVGCGTGHWLRQLWRRGFSVSGLNQAQSETSK